VERRQAERDDERRSKQRGEAMSQLTAYPHGHGSHDDPHAPHVEARKHLDMSAVVLPPGSGKVVSGLFVLLGVLCIAITFGLGMTAGGADAAAKHAAQAHSLAGYHMGFLYVLGLALGCLGLQMILQQFNAGWSAAVRRQAEVVASLMWVPALLFIPIAFLEVKVYNGALFHWMNEAYTAGDPIYAKKADWLNETGWIIRAIVYFAIWISLSTVLYRLSRKQDETGDRWLTARGRFISSFGLLIFALSTALASFDWLMSLDYHWFSTMFGVYFFAGCTLSTLCLLAVVMCTLRANGRFGATFTAEHQHDLGKLVLAFTVFWAYVTFCQYFLIWYSNIPEESAFYTFRKDGGYMRMFQILCVGHFLLPFVVLLFRKTKRSTLLLRVVAIWLLVMHAIDLYFMVRPNLKDVKLGDAVHLDILGIVGPVLLFVGLYIWKLSKVPLVPIKDPRLHEVLEHKNYV
jgi:hypothetical protein